MLIKRLKMLHTGCRLRRLVRFVGADLPAIPLRILLDRTETLIFPVS